MLRRRPRDQDRAAARREPPGEGAATGESFTFLRPGTVVRGALEAAGRVRLHGRIEGDVRVRGVLEVAEDGVVEGDLVEVEELKVLGRVRAEVRASVRVELWSGSTLEGDVVTPALDVEEGALFVGRSLMTRPGSDAHADAHALAVTAGADPAELAQGPAEDVQDGPDADVQEGPGGHRGGATAHGVGG